MGIELKMFVLPGELHYHGLLIHISAASGYSVFITSWIKHLMSLLSRFILCWHITFCSNGGKKSVPELQHEYSAADSMYILP